MRPDNVIEIIVTEAGEKNETLKLVKSFSVLFVPRRPG
jgi:hypothetical protein